MISRGRAQRPDQRRDPARDPADFGYATQSHPLASVSTHSRSSIRGRPGRADQAVKPPDPPPGDAEHDQRAADPCGHRPSTPIDGRSRLGEGGPETQHGRRVGDRVLRRVLRDRLGPAEVIGKRSPSAITRSVGLDAEHGDTGHGSIRGRCRHRPGDRHLVDRRRDQLDQDQKPEPVQDGRPPGQRTRQARHQEGQEGRGDGVAQSGSQ